MLTPAAKRRRVAAAETLRKPFKSPLVRRNVQPDTPKPLQPLPPSSSVPPDRSKRPSPVEAALPAKPQLSRKIYHTPVKVANASASPVLHANDDPLSAAVSRYQNDLDREIKQLDQQLETIRQAKRLLNKAQDKHPKEEPGVELRDLTHKWKGAARQAAEELYPSAKERFLSMGGMKGLKQMQKRQAAFFNANFDSDPRPAVANSQSSIQDGLSQRTTGRSSGEDSNEEDADEEFSMAMMLRSMNVEFDVIGYDPKEDGWTDSN